jgi:DNA-binding transcriptional regulator PaaX
MTDIIRKKGITKNILKGILLAGGIAIAATDPKFGHKILPELIKYAKYKLKNKKDKKKIYDTFYNLKKEDLIQFENRHGQLYISLTPEGKKKAGKYQIDNLEIKKPKKWDGKWRILIFDIENKKNIKREALRGKIKELGLFQLQKSVWVHPYNFYDEINLLRQFFGLSKNEMKMIIASEIEDDRLVRTHFKLN